jgi:S1-C subfamily serine protease
MKWFTHASSQGHAAAFNSIGVIFANPIDSGIKPDYKKSFDYFTQASNLGLPNADVNLGDSYLAGLGAEKNKSIAKEYYLKAAQNGSMNAKKKLLEHFDYSYTSKTSMEKQGDSSAKSNKFKPNDKVVESGIEKSNTYAGEKNTRKSQKTPVQIFSDLNLSVYKIVALNDEQLIDKKNDAQISQGSAVALSDRIAITNCHVLEGMNVFGAFINDEFVKFELAAKDKKKDLCVIRSSSPLTFAHLTKDYSRLKVGERVYAIGSPSGLRNTLSEGIVSGLREIKGIQHIQTTTPISPGSSGGGLFDAEGKLIGITTFGVGDKGNLNFAVSLDEAFPLLEAVK